MAAFSSVSPLTLFQTRLLEAKAARKRCLTARLSREDFADLLVQCIRLQVCPTPKVSVCGVELSVDDSLKHGEMEFAGIDAADAISIELGPIMIGDADKVKADLDAQLANLREARAASASATQAAADSLAMVRESQAAAADAVRAAKEASEEAALKAAAPRTVHEALYGDKVKLIEQLVRDAYADARTAIKTANDAIERAVRLRSHALDEREAAEKVGITCATFSLDLPTLN